MKYIFRNIKMFIRHEKMIFLVIVVCVLSSALILNFAYGLYQNFNTQKKEDNAELKEIVIDIGEDANLTRKEFQQYVESLSEETLNDMDIFIAGTLDCFQGCYYDTLDCRFAYRNGAYQVMESFRRNEEERMYSGRMITNEEENAGADVAVVDYIEEYGLNDYTKAIQNGEDTIELFGKTYHIVGEVKESAPTPVVPFLSIPEDFIFNDVVILDFQSVVNKREYTDLKTQADTIISDKLIFPELNLPDADSITLYNNIILISVLIAVLSLLNFAMLYHFILEKRGRDLAIMRICGCTKKKALLIYLGECLVLSIPVYVAGTGIFVLLLNRFFDDLFVYMKQSYTPFVYLIIFAGYILLMLFLLSIMILHHLNQSVTQEWREGRL